MEKLIMLRSYKAWEIMAVNGQEYRVDFRHSGWQQIKDKCAKAKCQNYLESTQLLKITRIKNLKTHNFIKPDSQEGLVIEKELADSLEKRCLNCWHPKKRKKIVKNKHPAVLLTP